MLFCILRDLVFGIVFARQIMLTHVCFWSHVSYRIVAQVFRGVANIGPISWKHMGLGVTGVREFKWIQIFEILGASLVAGIFGNFVLGIFDIQNGNSRWPWPTWMQPECRLALMQWSFVFLLRFRWHSKHSYNRQFYRRHLQVWGGGPAYARYGMAADTRTRQKSGSRLDACAVERHASHPPCWWRHTAMLCL